MGEREGKKKNEIGALFVDEGLALRLIEGLIAQKPKPPEESMWQM